MIDAAQVADLVRQELGARWANAPVHVVERPRTTLYFFSIDGREGKRDLVAKVKRVTPAERCRREYDALVEIERHFANGSDALLHAVRPVAYLETLNAIVMERIAGPTLYDAAMPLVRLATRKGRTRAAALMRNTGRWLRALHGVEPAGLQPRVTAGCARAIEGIAEEAARLVDLGVALDPAAVDRALDILRPGPEPAHVWLHSDFHLRNVHVVGADGVVGVDTALNWHGSPYADIGKFVADMKTRRERILRRGLFPTTSLLSELERAVLDGYHGGVATADWRQLRLFEGWFLLRKWRRTIQQARGLLGAAVRRAAIDPTYTAVVRRWSVDVRELDVPVG